MADVTRREFLTGVAGLAVAAGLGASGFPGASAAYAATRAAPSGKLPNPRDAPFDTVVVLMMENRSFDHFLGWLPGADGKQAGLSYVDQTGTSYDTYELAPDLQGCDLQDPFHTSPAMATHYNNGACDGFLQTQPNGDLFPIGYYTKEHVPILAKLAQSYTTFDNYFASMLGPTWPNRLYQLCATTDLTETLDFPGRGEPRPVNLQTAIYDRVSEAGLSAAYYFYGEPMTGLFSSMKYDRFEHHIDELYDDAKRGKLANVVFVDPDYTAHAEFNGTSNDFHPYGSIDKAQQFVAKVYNAMKDSPQWDRMVFVLNFDESGGFFDHVPPPPCQDDTVLSPSLGFLPELKRLGFRVPAIAMGPFAPRKIEQAGPYEHCSVLRMIEWRWGLEPMTLRDKTARNLALALDFSKRRDPVALLKFDSTPAEVCTNTNHLP